MSREICVAAYDEYGLHWEYIEAERPFSEILDLSQFIKEAHE